MTDLSELQVDSINKLTEQDFTLITRAQDEFNQKLYENCLQTLENLEQSIGTNFNLLHNKSIAKFYHNGCKNYDDLLKVLDIEDDNTPLTTKSGSETTIVYNKACIYYHLKKFYTAIEILNPIVERIEDMDEGTASSIGILMLCLLLSTNQLLKAKSFLKLLQMHLGINMDSLVTEETTSPENININGFRRMFKLIAVLTQVLNKDPIIIPDDGTVEFAILKAHQYYLGKDFQMAAKQLSRKFVLDTFSIEENGENHDTLIANNMGIIHLRVRHYAMAAKFFQHAITFDKKVANNLKHAPLHHLSAPQTPEILYNLGIALLHLHRPREAFKCFMVSLQVYYGNPRLWLRIAESCIMTYSLGKKESESIPILTPILSGENRRKYIIKPSSFGLNEEYDPDKISPSLQFAENCLTNALVLVKLLKNKFPPEELPSESSSDSHWSKLNDQNFCNPSMPVSREALESMESAIYAASSYVALNTQDYIQALHFGRILLELNNLSDAYKLIGHHYCAEALVHLDKIQEAMTLLDPHFVFTLNPYDLETKVWPANSLDAAQSITRYNLAVTLVLQGDPSAATQMLTTCIHPIVAHKVKDLKTYLNVLASSQI